MEGLHAEPVTFIAEEKFAGSRPGWAFKLGTEGLGHYQEGRMEKVEISILKLIRPMIDLHPVTLQLDEVLDFAAIIGDPCEATHADEEPDADDRPNMWEAPVKTKGQKAAARKKARRMRNAMTRQAGFLRLKNIDGDTFDELSTECMVGLKDRSHRDLGWWAFDSVNANAWPGAAEHLASTAADFTAVQEAKVEAQEVNDIEASSRGLGWRCSVGVCLHADGGGRSAGVAVAYRSHVGMADACDDDVLPENLLGRFRVKKMGAVCKGGVHFASAYLHSSIGATHHLNLDLLQSVAAVLSTLSGPWILAADFNCTPAELMATGWPKLVGGTIVAPLLPTCGERTIDFFVVSSCLDQAVLKAVVVGDSMCSPHSAVRLYIKAAPRQIMVRQLKSCATIGVDMPFGPARWRAEYEPMEAEATVDQWYDAFLDRLEAETVDLYPHA